MRDTDTRSCHRIGLAKKQFHSVRPGIARTSALAGPIMPSCRKSALIETLPLARPAISTMSNQSPSGPSGCDLSRLAWCHAKGQCRPICCCRPGTELDVRTARCANVAKHEEQDQNFHPVRRCSVRSATLKTEGKSRKLLLAFQRCVYFKFSSLVERRRSIDTCPYKYMLCTYSGSTIHS
jgi:hypothetical protein